MSPRLTLFTKYGVENGMIMFSLLDLLDVATEEVVVVVAVAVIHIFVNYYD